MKQPLLLILAGFCLTACGAAGLVSSAPKLDVKVGGKDSTLAGATAKKGDILLTCFR